MMKQLTNLPFIRAGSHIKPAVIRTPIPTETTMNLEEKIIERLTLKNDIKIKCQKIAKMTEMITRNKFELSAMVARHNKLDREIFEAKHGITRITAVRKVKSSEDLPPDFVDCLSPEACKLLLARLQSRETQQQISNH
jgi:hypothetical protein